MRSLVIDFEQRQVVEEHRPEPHLESPSGVLFRVHELGVCGTDRELVNLRLGPRPGDATRIVIGHEALGQVVECGADVRGFAPGDWVVPTIRRPCRPACPACARGRSDLCLTSGYSERGIFNLDGYFTEFAVDDASDLIAVPEKLLPCAVLLEPLSVVEKCVERIEALRQSDGRNALVLGLGPIGILASMTLALRGYRVTVYSIEPEDHPRVRIVAASGVRYTRQLDGRYDAIVEAAGSAALALAAVRLLGPCGVMLTLGAQRVQGEISFLDLIAGNQTLAGIVNASRANFELAVRDLALFPEAAVRAMIRRFAFGDFRRTLIEPSAAEPKIVHVIADSLH